MVSEIFLFIFGCIFFPTAFKTVVHLQKHNIKTELSDVAIYSIATRVVSTIQAVFACVSGFIIISSCKDVIYDSHWLTSAYICFGAPYFYYDTWAIYQTFWAKHPELHRKPFKFRFQRFLVDQPLMMLHHLVFPLFYFPIILYFRRGLGDFFIGCFYCIELAVPCLSLRGILLYLKKEDTLLYAVNGVVLIITYTCCRVLIFPFMYSSYGVQRQKSLVEVVRSIPIKCNVGCAVILSVQIYWLSQMLLIFVKTVRKKLTKRAQPIKQDVAVKTQ